MDLTFDRGEERRGRWTVQAGHRGRELARVTERETVYVVDADTPVRDLPGTLFFA